MKILANMWRELPIDERQEYEKVAESDKSRCEPFYIYFITNNKMLPCHIITVCRILFNIHRYFDEMARYSGPLQVPNKRQKKPPVSDIALLYMTVNYV